MVDAVRRIVAVVKASLMRPTVYRRFAHWWTIPSAEVRLLPA